MCVVLYLSVLMYVSVDDPHPVLLSCSCSLLWSNVHACVISYFHASSMECTVGDRVLFLFPASSKFGRIYSILYFTHRYISG